MAESESDIATVAKQIKTARPISKIMVKWLPYAPATIMDSNNRISSNSESTIRQGVFGWESNPTQMNWRPIRQIP